MGARVAAQERALVLDTYNHGAFAFDTAGTRVYGSVPSTLSPPNHQLVGVTASLAASDACGIVSIGLDSVQSNEADDAPGSAAQR